MCVAQAIADKSSNFRKFAGAVYAPGYAAAVADEHYFIEKEIVAGRTETSVRILSGKRVE